MDGEVKSSRTRTTQNPTNGLLSVQLAWILWCCAAVSREVRCIRGLYFTRWNKSGHLL